MCIRDRAICGRKKKSLDEIKEIIRKHKKELREKYNAKEIGIFGSIVRGEAKEGSDVDILVEFEKLMGFFKFLELEECLGRPPFFHNVFLISAKIGECYIT